MNMESRNQYLQTLLRANGYRLKSKKAKKRVLDEYCKNTGQNRKYVIRKINSGKYAADNSKAKKRKRKACYDGPVRTALVKCWKIFDYPCGQRLAPLLKAELDKLRDLGELHCSYETAEKLQRISFRTIDEKLKHQKEVERQKRKYHHKAHPLLYQKIPVKVFAEQDRNISGNIQIDLVEHCGNSAKGEFINTLSTTDINFGWWEGEVLMGKAQERTFQGLEESRKRYPFSWKDIHSDNGTEFINWHLFRYAQQERLDFSRSRPYKKNDNCLVEQKNWTHVKKFVGYLRYDTQEELDILSGLYRNELRLYKNFFQPVMKLVLKERVGGKIHRKYDSPKTPYKRVMESKSVSQKTKRDLEELYLSLNPAELKRTIDKKLNLLYAAYQRKNKTQTVEPVKKLKPTTVTFLIAQPEAISVT